MVLATGKQMGHVKLSNMQKSHLGEIFRISTKVTSPKNVNKENIEPDVL